MSGKALKVCVIDDNQDYLFAMETFLNKNGYQVQTASKGETGIELIRQQRPDLVLLDVMMETTFSGFEVCRQIRNDSALKKIPIVGISGMEEEIGVKFDKDEDAEYFSPDAFFDKPVNKDLLLETIRELTSE